MYRWIVPQLIQPHKPHHRCSQRLTFLSPDENIQPGHYRSFNTSPRLIRHFSIFVNSHCCSRVSGSRSFNFSPKLFFSACRHSSISSRIFKVSSFIQKVRVRDPIKSLGYVLPRTCRCKVAPQPYLLQGVHIQGRLSVD